MENTAMYQKNNGKRHILLGQLAARGDCLYATAIARQIKHDFPDCHLTWAIGSMCADIIRNNPYVDSVWELPIKNHKEVEGVWREFEKKACEQKIKGVYDEVFFTQISPGNLGNFDGTVRASIFRAYPYAISASVTPVLRLTDDEVSRVTDFVHKYSIQKYKHRILFEFSSHSGQSFVTPNFAYTFAQALVAQESDVCVVFSSNQSIESGQDRIFNAHSLSFRENAELANQCTLFIGCSSGISWLCTSDWVKPMPMIQLLKKGTSVYASMVHDFNYFGLSTESIIEMTDCTAEYLLTCVHTVISHGFDEARNKFTQEIPIRFDFYGNKILELLKHHRLRQAASSLWVTFKRYRGYRFLLIRSVVYKLCLGLWYTIIDALCSIKAKMVRTK